MGDLLNITGVLSVLNDLRFLNPLGILGVIRILDDRYANSPASKTSGTTLSTSTCPASHVTSDVPGINDVLSALSVLSSLGIIDVIKIIDD